MCNKIKIGKITGAQGLRGELKLFHDSGDEEALLRLSHLYLNAACEGYRIDELRFRKRTPIIKLAGVDSREAAEALTGTEIFADKEEARPKEEGAYFVMDLIGLKVCLHGGSDAVTGEIAGVIDNPAHEILEINTEKGILLLPFIDVFIREVDTAAGFIIITPPEGWLD